MAENSKISWTHHTWNCWIGCSKVSPACEHCYAEKMATRYGWVEWGPGRPRRRTSPMNWLKPLAMNRKAVKAGVRHRVFCASLADVFDAEVVQAWREDLWKLIAKCPQLDWLLLTKRPQNVKDMVPKAWLQGAWPMNVWLGTTVEDQKRVDERLPHLTALPAPVRFLSCEPLLEEIELKPWLGLVDWIIVGGESGQGARPFDTRLVRTLVASCRAAGVTPFVKQVGTRPTWLKGTSAVTKLADYAGADPSEWPVELRVQEFPRPRDRNVRACARR